MAKYDSDLKQYARALYLRKYSIPEIADKISRPHRTLYNWCESGNWNDLLKHESVEEAIQRRIIILTEKSDKKERDLNEIDRLIKQLSALAKVRHTQIINEKLKATPAESDAVTAVTLKTDDKKNRRQKQKNDVSGLEKSDFKVLHKQFFDYQKELYNQRHHRNRQLLKSRQIGATWYFAQEALEDAVLTGDNQIFLSATRAQAEVFRSYIIEITKKHFKIELKGNPIVLNTKHGDATLYFLSNNSKSAQSYHGHVYIDEFFWITKFNELYKVATGMAAHKKWRRTLFSTPSSINHPAYSLWSGERFLQRYKRKIPPEFPDKKNLESGIVCPDNTWRKIITLDNAEAGGCNLFNKEELKLEYSTDEYNNLFECGLVDDTLSVFNFEKLENCMIDTEIWDDAEMLLENNYPVWCGYDPSRHRDDASFVVILPPLEPGGIFRVVKRMKWFNKSYIYQAGEIEKVFKEYNVAYIGIDVTGVGLGVFDLVHDFFPQATPIHYSIQSKTRMVIKGCEIIKSGRLQYSAEWTDVGHAFLTIRQATTANGAVTYCATRTDTTGHADIAWSIMHALDHEPLNPNRTNTARVAVG